MSVIPTLRFLKKQNGRPTQSVATAAAAAAASMRKVVNSVGNENLGAQQLDHANFVSLQSIYFNRHP